MVHGHPFHVNPWNGCNPPIRFNRLQLEKKPSPMNSPFNHHTREESTNLTMTQVAHVVSVQLNSRKTAAYDETLMKFSWCFFWLVVYLPLWKIWKSVGMIIPSIWKKHVPNHQPVYHMTIRGILSNVYGKIIQMFPNHQPVLVLPTFWREKRETWSGERSAELVTTRETRHPNPKTRNRLLKLVSNYETRNPKST